MLTTKINAFWDWFQENEQQYFDLKIGDPNQEDLFNQLLAALKELHENLAFEFSVPLKDGKREFVITAQGMQQAFPVVFQMHEQAPELSNWVVIALKPKLGQELTLNIGETTFGLDDIYFKWAKDGDKLALQLHLRGAFPENLRVQLGFLMLDALLGEYDVTTKLGHLEFVELQEGVVDQLTTIRELPQLVDDVFYTE